MKEIENLLMVIIIFQLAIILLLIKICVTLYP